MLQCSQSMRGYYACMKKSRLEKKENAGIMNVLFVLFIIYGAILLATGILSKPGKIGK